MHDSAHRAAVSRFNALAAAGRRLVVTNYVVSETYTLLLRLHGNHRALAFLKQLRSSRTVTKIQVPVEWEAKAEELLAKYSDHELSYVDATSFVAMRELGLREVLTFDSDFALGGFEVLSP